MSDNNEAARAVDDRGDRVFGPERYTYDDLTFADPAEALNLGVPGSDPAANSLRAQVAAEVVSEYYDRLDVSIQTGGAEPEVVFGAQLVDFHDGDLRAVLADEKFTADLHQLIGSGWTSGFTETEDGFREYESFYVDPESPQQQAAVAELRSNIETAVTVGTASPPETTPTTAVTSEATPVSHPQTWLDRLLRRNAEPVRQPPNQPGDRPPRTEEPEQKDTLSQYAGDSWNTFKITGKRATEQPQPPEQQASAAARFSGIVNDSQRREAHRDPLPDVSTDVKLQQA